MIWLCLVTKGATACSAFISGHIDGSLVCTAVNLLCAVHQTALYWLLLSLITLLHAGTCSLAAPQPSYQQCAVDAGASVLANGTLTDVTKASSVFTYSPAACNYPSKQCCADRRNWNTL